VGENFTPSQSQQPKRGRKPTWKVIDAQMIARELKRT
jgi:hypothetical protein